MTLLVRAAFPALTRLRFQSFRLSPIVASYWTANRIGSQSILADSVGLEPRQQEIYKQTALPTRSIEIQCSACGAIPYLFPGNLAKTESCGALSTSGNQLIIGTNRDNICPARTRSFPNSSTTDSD